MRRDVSGFIAGKLRFEGRLAMLSIALSFFIIIIAVAVSSGFRREIRNAVSKVGGDIQVTGLSMNVIGEDDPLDLSDVDVSSIEDVRGVSSVSGVIYRAGIIRIDGSIEGVLFKGTQDDTVSMGARIPSSLAGILSLKVGDSFTSYFVGDRIKARKFTVAGIYPSVLDIKEAMMIYVPIADMRRLNAWEESEVSALEVTLRPDCRSKELVREINSEIGSRLLFEDEDSFVSPLVSTSVIQRYPRLFDWLDLIDTNVVLVLVLMTIVAGFNMISGLLILLFRNISTIGILKSMGMTNKGIRSVFLRVSSVLVLKGMALGNAVGLLCCLLQGLTHVVRLNPSNYFVPFVPVSVNLPLVLAADAFSLAAILALLLLPCMFIAKVDPARTVRAQ